MWEPRNLIANADPPRREWLSGLPVRVERIVRDWGLTDLGRPYQPGGVTSWVAPVGADAVLKVLWRHDESRDEAAGLRVWDGAGAVRVFRALDHDDTTYLLLERCTPGTTLAEVADPDEQDRVIAGLLRRLRRDMGPDSGFRPLSEMCDAWAGEFAERWAAAPAATRIDRGLAAAGLASLRRLPRDARRSVLLCTDLHAGNVLAAQREPWLLIDPKPYVGDPAYDLVQHIRNGPARLLADPFGVTGRLADMAGVDRDRLRRWVFARCVVDSLDFPACRAVAEQMAEIS